MRNKFLIFLLSFSITSTKIFGDTTSVNADSSITPFVPPDNGPLGIDHLTGLALYGAALLFAILIIALWRKNIINKGS